jgi:hypothetical protein
MLLIHTIGLDSVKRLLNQEKISQWIVKRWIWEELDSVFSSYIQTKEESILKYLVTEDLFEKAIYDVFVSHKSERVLWDILQYIENKDPLRELVELEVKFFQYPSELCAHFEYALTNK